MPLFLVGSGGSRGPQASRSDGVAALDAVDVAWTISGRGSQQTTVNAVTGTRPNALARPCWALREEVREVDLQHAELVGPRVAEDPEVVAAFLLVVPPRGTERFEPLDLGLDVVGLQVQVHALLVALGVVGALQQDAHRGVGQAESAVDVAA